MTECIPTMPLRAGASWLCCGRPVPGRKLLPQCVLPRGLTTGWKNAARSCTGLPQLLDALTTVRYPRARMRRLAMDAALGYTADTVPALPPYLHLLGKAEVTLVLLKHAALPVSHSLAKLEKENDACAFAWRRHRQELSDFGALCQRCPPMGGEYRQKLSF